MNESTASQQASDQARWRLPAQMWLRWAVIFSISHGLLVWWSIANISDRSWTMDGGGVTLVELLAGILAIVLNLPIVIICRMLPVPPFAWTYPPVLIANSFFCGMAVSFVFARMTNIRRKKSAFEISDIVNDRTKP